MHKILKSYINEMGVMGAYEKELVILVKVLYGFNITSIFVAVKDIKSKVSYPSR